MSNSIVIKNGSVITPARILRRATVIINGRKIARVGGISKPSSALAIDAAGCYVSPGFIDTHIHGDPRDILDNEIKHGTTSVLIAESCASLKAMGEKAAGIKRFMAEDPLGPSVLGVRFEGPYISRIKAGAQDKRYIRRPDTKELSGIIKRSGPMLRMMTIAPEEAGAIALVHALVGRKVIASIGHSAATCEEAARGISAGINHATHIFNAMRGSDGSDEGVAGAVLYDRKVFAEVILDLVHVSRASFALLMRAKYPDKAILITDSVKALRQNGVKKSLGAYRFADGRLAGSALTMIAAVKNAVKRCGLSLADAVRLATLNPARLLGLDRSKGSIKPGNDADIVIFDKDFNVKMTIVRGKIMYRTKGF